MKKGFSREILAKMEEISMNLEGENLSLHYTEDGCEISNNQGTVLFYPLTEAEGHRGKETELDICLEYLFRYKYAQYNPSYMPKLYKNEIGYKSCLSIRHEHAFYRFGDVTCKLLTDIFCLKEGDQVFEGGAYIGFSTIRMAQALGEKGKIVSCEAIKENFKVLERNIKKNKLQNVIPLNYAVGPKYGKSHIYKTTRQRNSIIPGVCSGGVKEEVNVRKIHNICEECKIVPNFLILTINGAELVAIESSLSFLESLKNVRIIAPVLYSDSYGNISERLKKLLISVGYTVYSGKTCYAFK